MHLLTLICGIVLLQRAYAVKCYTCTPGFSKFCQDEVTDCSSQGQICGVHNLRTFTAGISSDIHIKSCTLHEECINGSVNYGLSRTVFTSRCCDTELCNKQKVLDVPSAATPNGKKCYGCSPGAQCTTPFDCVGNEDRCFSSTVVAGGIAMTLRGCSSKQLCSTSGQMLESLGAEFSCCVGNLCNSARRAGVGLLLLVAPLLTSMFS